MKRILPFVWIASVILALLHLLFLAAYQISLGFWVFSLGLLLCYSLPFLALANIRIPQNPSLLKYIIYVLFLTAFAFSLFIPLRRFLPGYRPDALEALIYLFMPPLELLVILPFLLIGRAKPKASQDAILKVPVRTIFPQ